MPAPSSRVLHLALFMLASTVTNQCPVYGDELYHDLVCDYLRIKIYARRNGIALGKDTVRAQAEIGELVKQADQSGCDDLISAFSRTGDVALSIRKMRERTRKSNTDREPHSAYENHIRNACRIYPSVDPDLVKAVITVESNGNHNAVSSKGAKGLMQIMPETARTLGATPDADLFDPATNIFLGTKYLDLLFTKFDDIRKVLIAYNAGPAALKWSNLPDETRKYVPKVLLEMETLRKERGN